jgi:hypothetical protein
MDITKELNMKPTIKSPYPYHHVIIGKDQKHVVLCIYNGNGDGGDDHWLVDAKGHKRCHGFNSGDFFADYWQDMVNTEVGRNVYEVLDFYVEKKDEENNVLDINYCSDDIPF